MIINSLYFAFYALYKRSFSDFRSFHADILYKTFTVCCFFCFTGGYLTVQDAPYNTPLGAAFLQAGEEMGYSIVDVNGEQQTGFAFYQFTMRRATRCSSAKAFLRPIRLRPNFHLALWTHVTKVLIEPRTKRAYGVEFIRDGRVQVVYAKKEVILSAGAINSPQLLMLSGVGPGYHLHEMGIPVIKVQFDSFYLHQASQVFC